MEIKQMKYISSILSKYIQRELFLYLNEKQILDMIIYNKQLQMIFQKDIKDYQRISGKYKIGEKNGIGRIYMFNTDELIFEGEFLNGKKNGKGKEYYYRGELKFDGEYLYHKMWHGKGFNIKGDIEFEIKDGNGYIKEYNIAGQLNFEGEYKNGERNGKGKEYKYGRLRYEGE